MTAFRDMTRAELEAAIADDLRDYMGKLVEPGNTPAARAQIITDMHLFDRHFEVIAHPLTEAEKAARHSARMELRAKTAWGHLELVRQGLESPPHDEP